MMQAEVEEFSLVRQKKAMDLCVAACRKRQSCRTGFIHYVPGEEHSSDLIPLYENFCFAIALYRQKTMESALEGKALLEKLLAFQSLEGNFPIYLHEFPRCYNKMQALKIAPLLLQLQRRFSLVLAPDLKQRLSNALEKMLAYYQEPLSGLWQFRYEMCKYGKSSLEPLLRSSLDVTEWLISMQLGEEKSFPVSYFFHPELQLFISPPLPQIQQTFEPQPQLIEWLLAEPTGAFSSRLLRDHPMQMELSSLWPLAHLVEEVEEETVIQEQDRFMIWKKNSDQETDGLRIFWGKDPLNSFILPRTPGTHISLIGKNQWEILFELPEDADQTDNDLYEALFFCSASPEIRLSINERRGTTFSLGDQIEITSSSCRICLYFELLSGTGRFRGHFSKANRPSQVKTNHYEAYDWRIGLRTLSRSPKATVRVVCSYIPLVTQESTIGRD